MKPLDILSSHGNRCIAYLAVLVFGGLFTVDFVSAQNQNVAKPDHFRYWMETGIGLSAAGGDRETSFGGGWAVRAAPHVQYDRLVFSVPFTYSTGGGSNYDSVWGGKMSDEYFDIGLMAGYALNRGGRTQVVLSSGVTRVQGRQVRLPEDDGCSFFCNEDDARYETSRAAVGVPVAVGFHSSGDRVLGMSVTTYLNVNAVKSYWGVTVNLMIGNRRRIN